MIRGSMSQCLVMWTGQDLGRDNYPERFSRQYKENKYLNDQNSCSYNNDSVASDQIRETKGERELLTYLDDLNNQLWF